MKENYWKKLGIPAVVFLRLTLPPLLWQNPLLVWMLVFLLDWFDGDVFRQAFYYQRNGLYQLFDKTADLYGYCWALVFSCTTRSPVFGLLLFFFLLRAVGTAIFLVRRKRKVFIFFPNIFENLFIVYAFTLTFPSLKLLLRGTTLCLTVSLLTILALVREYFLHVREVQFHQLLTGKRWV
jgi:voltage-gated potassium channel Kch